MRIHEEQGNCLMKNCMDAFGSTLGNAGFESEVGRLDPQVLDMCPNLLFQIDQMKKTWFTTFHFRPISKQWMRTR